jgi:hypothetical protein
MQELQDAPLPGTQHQALSSTITQLKSMQRGVRAQAVQLGAQAAGGATAPQPAGLIATAAAGADGTQDQEEDPFEHQHQELNLVLGQINATDQLLAEIGRGAHIAEGGAP